MNVSLTYSKGCIQHLAALSAACSKSVSLYNNPDNDFTLSMGPYCTQLTSQNAIICFILNFNPLDKNFSDILLWQSRSIKAPLYNVYRNCNATKLDKSHLSVLENVIKEVSVKLEGKLLPLIRPLELVLWADLYPLLSGCLSTETVLIPAVLSKWFNDISKLVPLQRALKLSFENISVQNSLKNLPNLPVIKEVILGGPSTSSSSRDIFLNGHETVILPPQFSTPKLPLPNTRNILITSALPYVNNVPHLGNLIGSTLSADVFSRYCRVRGYNSIYVCGTDEYGTATVVKSITDGCTPREICDLYHRIHSDVYKWFQIDFDVFGRTSDEEHTALVTSVFEDIHRQGFISEKEVKQLYCEACDMFLADRFVEGICPNPECKYEDARGDQCDKCTKTYNAIELVEPRCKICSKSPCIRPSTHLFLDLAKIQPDLEKFLETRMTDDDCIWSTNAKSITKDWLKKGLESRSITRDLKWGVPVPLDEFRNKVFYVWFDAVLGYLSITSKYTPDWRQWWLPSDKDSVQLYQFMAKDNVPFHSVLLPANLLATGQKYTMLKQLASTEYLNYENSKFSKSRSTGVFGPDAAASGIDSDVWRFYLVCVRPESQDSAFLWDDFAARNNSELLNNLGNFVNRALSFLVKFFGGVVPEMRDEMNAEDDAFIEEVDGLLAEYADCMERTKMRRAVHCILSITRLGNVYLQKNAPWVLVKDESTRPRAGAVVAIAANVAVLLGPLLAPVMPTAAAALLDQCRAPAAARHVPHDLRLRALLGPGHAVGEVAPLFAKIEPETVADLKRRFGGVA